MLASVRDANASGAARRRQRRLRQWLRARASERRNGPGRDVAPHRPTGTEDGQGRGGGSRDALHGDGPDASSSPGGRHRVLRALRRRRGACQGFPAHPVWVSRGATGARSAAYRGADCRLCPYGTDSRRSCAAVG